MPDPDAARDPLDELVSEFTERIRRGEKPTVDEYAERHPDLADEIRELLPTITAIEKLKVHKEHSSDGRASLGAVKLERLGDFRIVREIGRGGMGIVFEAEQESLHRRVAIKVLPRYALMAPEQLERFRKEAQIAASLIHAGIVPVFGFGEQEGFHYIVMQYIEGAPLDSMIADIDGKAEVAARPESRPADYWRTVARIGRRAAEALHHAHTQGTLHRDIKPGNLLLDSDGSVWITDFGVAKALEAGDASRTGDITGTLRYMAPERFEGRTDARSDIYSLGLTLFELLTRRPAFEGKDQSSLIRTITQQVLPQPRRIDPEIPRDLETIVLKAAAHDPDRRYRTAGDLAADLGRYLESRPIEARRTTAVEHLWLWSRRNPLPASLSAAVLLLLCLIAVTAGIGYIQTRNANIETNLALDGEKKQRAKAETVSALAREVLDGIYSRFAARRTAGQPDFTFENSGGDTITIPVRTVLSAETAALLEDLLVFYDRLAEQDAGNSELRRETARAHRRVGTIHQYLCHFDLAEAAFRKAVAIYTELRDSGDQARTLEIAEIRNALGGVYRSSSRIGEAFDEHFAALGILEEAAADSSSPEARFELARTFYFLGTRPRPEPGPGPGGQRPGGPGRHPPDSGEPPPPPPAGPMSWDPLSYMDKAVAILMELRRAYPASPEYAHLLACCHRDRSHLLESKRAAHDNLTEAAAILEQLAREFPGAPDYRYDLSETYSAWDVRRMPHDLLPLVEEDLRRALVILEGLMAEYPSVPTYTMACVHTHHKLADVLQRTGHSGRAEESLNRAIDLQSALVGRFPEIDDHKLWLVEIRKSRARFLRDENRLPEARALLESVIADLEPLLEQDGPSDGFRRSLTDAYINLADVLHRSGADLEGDEAAERAEELHRDAPESRRDEK